MPKFNTGNPVGSSDPRDLYDNAENLDNLVNGDQAAYNDRLGKSRRSWQSVEDQVNQQADQYADDKEYRDSTFASDQTYRADAFQAAQDDREGVFNAYLVSAGYTGTAGNGDVEDYAAGIEITQYNQVVRDTSGEFWRVSGSTTLPYTTTGAGLPEGGAFVAVGDGVLRQELGQGVRRASNLQALQSISGRFSGDVAYLVGRTTAGDGGEGEFRWDASDLSASVSADTQQGVYVAPASAPTGVSGAWVRQYSGPVNVLWFGVVTGTDSTTEAQAALEFGSGKGVFWPVSDSEYIAGPLIPQENTVVTLEPGVVINAPSGGTRVFQLQRENVHIWAYGAKTVMDGTQSSHNVYILHPAKNVSVHGLFAEGSGSTGDDCFYIGGDPASGKVSENVRLIDCKGRNAKRNICSVVACHGYEIYGCEFYEAQAGILGVGIDLEANTYMPDGSNPVQRGVIRKCKIHDNAGIGIAVIFGEDCDIIENEVYNNASEGIATGAGGAQFNAGVARDGDLLGINSFDLATGEIEVRSSGNSLWDLGYEIGTVVQLNKRNSATYPSELNFTRGFISSISADGLKIKISPHYDYGEVTSFSGSGTGTRSYDPFVADLYMLVYREGQCSNIRIGRGNKLYGNGAAGQIRLQTAVGVTIDRAYIDMAGVAGTAISASFCRRVSITNCTEIYGRDIALRGINIGTCSKVTTENNRVTGFTSEGMIVDGSHIRCTNDTVENCGTTGNKPFRVQLCQNGKFSPRVFNDTAHPSNYGIILENSVTNSLVTGANCKDAGADNASSIISLSATNRIIDSIQRDGSFR